MKLISWNVNGIRACVKKGFLEFFAKENADIFCIQETKVQEEQIPFKLEGYHQYSKKGLLRNRNFLKKRTHQYRLWNG